MPCFRADMFKSANRAAANNRTGLQGKGVNYQIHLAWVAIVSHVLFTIAVVCW